VGKGGLATILTGAGLRAGQVIAHRDEMRLGVVGQVRRVWAPRGVQVRQRRRIVYQWRYLALAVDGDATTLRWQWVANLKQETVVKVVETWQKEGVVGLVWDKDGLSKSRYGDGPTRNLRKFTSRALRKKLARNTAFCGSLIWFQ
jgi:hypothetical protein